MVLTSVVLALDEPGRAYLSTVSRSSSILLGAFLATLVHRRQRVVDLVTQGRTGDAVGVVAIAYLIWSWTSIDGASELAFYKGGFFAHALAVTALIAIVTQRSDGRIARVLSFAPFRQLGVVSYGFYLWHWPVILIFNLERVGYGGFGLLVTRLVITLAVTVASYWVIERPARRSWSKRPSALVGLPIAALIVAVALVAATVQPTRTAVVGAVPSATPSHADATKPVERASAVQEITPDQTADHPDTTDAALVEEVVPDQPDELPLVSTTPHPPTLRTPSAAEPLRVLLVGDSYLYDAQLGIEAALEATGFIDVAPAGILGFALTWEDGLPTLINQVAEHNPELVVTMWARFDEAWLASSNYDAESRSAYGELLDDAFAVLGADGAAIAVVGLAPSLTSGIDRVPLDLTINELFLESVARFDRAFYLDPNPIVAPAGEPVRWIESGGPLLVRKPDVSHYCPDGAARFGLAVSQLVATITETTPAEPADWWAGDWRLDQRYDDPPSGCTG